MDKFIGFIKVFSFDSVSDSGKAAADQVCDLLNDVSQDWHNNVGLYKRISELAIDVADENILAGITCLDLMNGVAFVSLPSLKGGSSWPPGGGQPFEFYWHLKNTYFNSLCRIAWMAHQRSVGDFNFVIEKLIYELGVVKEFYLSSGKEDVNASLSKLLRSIKSDTDRKAEIERRFKDIGFIVD